MRNILILGGGGFIGGHLAKRLSDSNFVRVVDIKPHEYFNTNDYCSEFINGDLRDKSFVEDILLYNKKPFDEIYQLAADMGGAGYIFTGENDANVMYNSSIINLNVLHNINKIRNSKIFFSSSACIYPEHNQTDYNSPNCEESSAYPANPDSEYGWEKLFSERLYLSNHRNYNLNIRIARFHNIFGPYGTYKGGKEKAPAAICRKVVECKNGEAIEIWGNGLQTRSFLYIDECLDAIDSLMSSNFFSPINIGSEESISINDLARMIIRISEKKISINNLSGERFFDKYGYKCPIGVNGRKSDNKLFKEVMKWQVSQPLQVGIEKTYKWIFNELSIT